LVNPLGFGAINETYAPVVTAVGKLIDACVACEAMRPGLEPADVLLLMGFMWRVEAGPEGKRQAERITDLSSTDWRRDPARTT
jgi:hypothetical protein